MPGLFEPVVKAGDIVVVRTLQSLSQVLDNCLQEYIRRRRADLACPCSSSLSCPFVSCTLHRRCSQAVPSSPDPVERRIVSPAKLLHQGLLLGYLRHGCHIRPGSGAGTYRKVPRWTPWTRRRSCSSICVRGVYVVQQPLKQERVAGQVPQVAPANEKARRWAGLFDKMNRVKNAICLWI
jgi:hypothetical protein